MLKASDNRLRDKTAKNRLTLTEIAALRYHDLFDYPLTLVELIKWQVGKKVIKNDFLKVKFDSSGDYFYLKGRRGLILKRKIRERASQRKLKKARKAAKLLSLVPTIKLVSLTGALAMKNSDEESDIDLMIITSKKTLWSTRIVAWLLLKLSGFDLRKPNQKDQKDKLCLNLWLDETSLVWRKRNIFTAHEIAQVVPLMNKKDCYEKFILKNKWIKDFWPNSIPFSRIRVNKDRENLIEKVSQNIAGLLNPLSYRVQGWYMRDKRTCEIIAVNKALFHPQDWSSLVVTRWKEFTT